VRYLKKPEYEAYEGCMMPGWVERLEKRPGVVADAMMSKRTYSRLPSSPSEGNEDTSLLPFATERLHTQCRVRRGVNGAQNHQLTRVHLLPPRCRGWRRQRGYS
jgi:hypothetical protein